MGVTKLLTAAEFAESEYENLKEFLGTYDIQINKVGLIGYLINLLGNIKYDSQTYYNELFKNAFIPTTIDTDILYLHSAIYNYIADKAKPSKAIGTITFDFSLLSTPSDDIIKRQIVLRNISFQNNNIQFHSDIQYSFVEERTNNQIVYYAVLTDINGDTEYFSSPSSAITVPFKNISQYIIEETIITVPNYEYGTYYSIVIDSKDDYLFDLNVDVRLADKQYDTSTDYDKLDIQYISYLSSPGDMVCFLKPMNPKTWELKLGSGLHGMYVQNSELKLTKYLTKGKIGNILVSGKVLLSSSTIIDTFYTSITNGEIQKSLNLSSVFDINFESSYDGTDIVTGQELQKKLINYIQTRDTLINKKDFYNLKYETDSEFVYSFRKSLLQQNTFFFYKLILNSYNSPVKSLCYNVPQINITMPVLNLVATQNEDSDGELIDGTTYKYTVRASDGFNYSLISNLAVETIASPNNKISLTWDSFTNAEYYLISVTTDDINYKYYKTRDLFCSDFGNNFNSMILDFTGLKYIHNPTYSINNQLFISPFTYKYNTNMRWYDGYLFYNSFIINFVSMSSNTQSNTISSNLPICYFQVKYDNDEKKTIFFVRSYQDLTNYELKLTLSNTSFIDQTMIMIDQNTFSIDYLPGDENIIEGDHKLTLTLNNTIDNINIVFESSTFYQLKKITDQLFLPTFENGTLNRYILSIPLLDDADYNINKLFYDDLFLKLFHEDLISEKRFPSDNIQARFLNTYKLPGDILKYNTIQKYDFDLVLPLKLSIKILLDKNYIIFNHIELNKEQDDIYLNIAQELQDNYTGAEIKYYNSKLIEYVHYSRDYIKQVSVTVTDSDNNLISNGLELISEQDTIDAIQDDDDTTIVIETKKMNILDFFPIYIHWDLDNIDIDYRFDL